MKTALIIPLSLVPISSIEDGITDIDTSIVTDHMMMQVTELGLGSVWVCYFKPDVLRKEFSIPANL